MPHIQQHYSGDVYYDKGKPLYFRFYTGTIGIITGKTDHGDFMCKVLMAKELDHAKECFAREQHKKER